jgi:hypothetical protein
MCENAKIMRFEGPKNDCVSAGSVPKSKLKIEFCKSLKKHVKKKSTSYYQQRIAQHLAASIT